MKNHIKIKLIVFLLCFVSLGCSNDDERDILKNMEGTVVNSVICGTIHGSAYKIAVDGFDTLIVAALPSDFQQVGIRIKFDMEKSSEEFEGNICTEVFLTAYKLSNITLEVQ